ncbi:MAG: DUF6165 family protein [Wenzhouxiangella sp.]|jgi:hypothetical protein|nr:DUF6165 family protein [Wenzhouxiangella sp.]
MLLIPVAPGELLDKLTILDIKSERIGDPDKLANVRRERELLDQVWRDSGLESEEIFALREHLKSVNESLWEIEDAIRDEERAGRFGKRFIELARSVYLTNDKRAALKKAINQALGSDIVEEKSYRDYRSG